MSRHVDVTPSPILTLPVEVLQHSMTFCTLPEVARCCEISTRWNEAGGGDDLWEQLIARDFTSRSKLAKVAALRRGGSGPASVKEVYETVSVHAASTDSGQSRVQVAVSIRPMNKKEAKNHTFMTFAADPAAAQIGIIDEEDGERRATFGFDRVYCSEPSALIDSPDPLKPKPFAATQVGVYNGIGRPMVDHAFRGYNVCLFAYGQTGSGKTYRMFGPGGIGSDVSLDGPERGVIPRMLEQLFATVAEKVSSGLREYTVKVGYVEMYGDAVIDLLSEKKKILKVTFSTKHALVDQHLETARSVEDVLSLVDVGNERRRTLATRMNDRSSRSHAVVTIRLHERRLAKVDEGTAFLSGISSEIHLVDLAGSERIVKSGAEGQRRTEAISINKGLTVLGRVIGALADGSSKIPYRDSPLTSVLRNALGGNSKTALIATVSPAAEHVPETLGTMRFASRTREVVNHTWINLSPMAKKLIELERRVEELETQLREAGIVEDEALKRSAAHKPSAAALEEELELLRFANADLRHALQMAREQRDEDALDVAATPRSATPPPSGKKGKEADAKAAAEPSPAVIRASDALARQNAKLRKQLVEAQREATEAATEAREAMEAAEEAEDLLEERDEELQQLKDAKAAKDQEIRELLRRLRKAEAREDGGSDSSSSSHGLSTA